MALSLHGSHFAVGVTTFITRFAVGVTTFIRRWFMIRYVAALVVLAVFSTEDGRSQSLDTSYVTMSQAINAALDASPEVAAVAARRDFATARHQFARASRFLTDARLTTLHSVAPGLTRDPEWPDDALYLDPSVRNDWEDLRPFNRFELDLRQPIYTWGELGGSIRAAGHGVDVENAAVEMKASEVALRTAELYQGLLLAEALDRLVTEAGDVLETADRELNRLLDEGDPSVDDADLFKLQITEQEFLSRVAEVRERRATASVALSRQLMMPPGSVSPLPGATLEPLPLPAESLEAYQYLAQAHRPEVRQVNAGIAARRALVDVARSGYYPTIFVAAQANYAFASGRFRQPNPFIGDPFRSRAAGAAIGLRQNLNFGQTRARVEQARAELDEVRFQDEALQQLVLFEAEEAFRNVQIARERMEARQRSLAIAREWQRTEQINFDLALGDARNLIEAVQARIELESSHLEAVSRYNIAILRLFHVSGLLVNHARSADRDQANGTPID
jgi:outer membrane protein